MGLCLGFSNTSHVDSLYRFGKSVVNKVKFDTSILSIYNISKEYNIKIQYANEAILNMVLDYPKNMFIN